VRPLRGACKRDAAISAGSGLFVRTPRIKMHAFGFEVSEENLEPAQQDCHAPFGRSQGSHRSQGFVLVAQTLVCGAPNGRGLFAPPCDGAITGGCDPCEGRLCH